MPILHRLIWATVQPLIISAAGFLTEVSLAQIVSSLLSGVVDVFRLCKCMPSTVAHQAKVTNDSLVAPDWLACEHIRPKLGDCRPWALAAVWAQKAGFPARFGAVSPQAKSTPDRSQVVAKSIRPLHDTYAQIFEDNESRRSMRNCNQGPRRRPVRRRVKLHCARTCFADVIARYHVDASPC